MNAMIMSYLYDFVMAYIYITHKICSITLNALIFCLSLPRNL